LETGAIKYPIEDPENHTITFGEDGAMSCQADCNQANAEYVLGAAGALTITPRPSTLAACAEGSLSEKSVQALGSVVSFQTDGKAMVLFANTESGLVIMLLEIVDQEAPCWAARFRSND